MGEIKKEFFCRLGQDWRSGKPFIGELMGLPFEIGELVSNELGKPVSELHTLTCGVVKSGKKSITGENGLARKVLKLKIKVVLEECELVDDVEQK